MTLAIKGNLYAEITGAECPGSVMDYAILKSKVSDTFASFGANHAAYYDVARVAPDGGFGLGYVGDSGSAHFLFLDVSQAIYTASVDIVTREMGAVTTIGSVDFFGAHLIQLSQSGSVLTFTVDHVFSHTAYTSGSTFTPCFLIHTDDPLYIEEMAVGDVLWDIAAATSGSAVTAFRLFDGVTKYSDLVNKMYSTTGSLTTGDANPALRPFNASRSLYRTNHITTGRVYDSSGSTWTGNDLTDQAVHSPWIDVGQYWYGYRAYGFQGSSLASYNGYMLYLDWSGYLFYISETDLASPSPRYNKNWHYTYLYDAESTPYPLNYVRWVSASLNPPTLWQAEPGEQPWVLFDNCLFSIATDMSATQEFYQPKIIDDNTVDSPNFVWYRNQCWYASIGPSKILIDHVARNADTFTTIQEINSWANAMRVYDGWGVGTAGTYVANWSTQSHSGFFYSYSHYAPTNTHDGLLREIVVTNNFGGGTTTTTEDVSASYYGVRSFTDGYPYLDVVYESAYLGWVKFDVEQLDLAPFFATTIDGDMYITGGYDQYINDYPPYDLYAVPGSDFYTLVGKVLQISGGPGNSIATLIITRTEILPGVYVITGTSTGFIGTITETITSNSAIFRYNRVRSVGGTNYVSWLASGTQSGTGGISPDPLGYVTGGISPLGSVVGYALDTGISGVWLFGDSHHASTTLSYQQSMLPLDFMDLGGGYLAISACKYNGVFVASAQEFDVGVSGGDSYPSAAYKSRLIGWEFS